MLVLHIAYPYLYFCRNVKCSTKNNFCGNSVELWLSHLHNTGLSCGICSNLSAFRHYCARHVCSHLDTPRIKLILMGLRRKNKQITTTGMATLSYMNRFINTIKVTMIRKDYLQFHQWFHLYFMAFAPIKTSPNNV